MQFTQSPRRFSSSAAIFIVILICMMTLSTFGKEGSKKSAKKFRPLCANDPLDVIPDSIPPCSVPVEELPTGRVIGGSRERPTGHQLPAWVNVTLARQGQNAARASGLGFFLTSFFGLLATLTIPDGRDILMFTGNTADKKKAFKRYAATGIQALVWMDAEISAVQKDNAFLKSLANVRELHVEAANKATMNATRPWYDPGKYKNVKIDNEMWKALDKDLKASKIPIEQKTYSKEYHSYDNETVPINQFVQSLTLFGFVGYLFMDPESVYVYDPSEEDMRAILHLWSVIGYAIGIDDDYNICLQPDVESARKYFTKVQEQYFTPGLFNLDHDTKVLVEALISNYNSYIPGMGARGILYRYMKQTIKIPVKYMNKILSWADWGAQKLFDYWWVKKTKQPGFGQAFYSTMQDSMNAVVLTNFGPYFTSMQRAQNVLYYNSSVVHLL